jgi:putative membrane protein
MKKSFTTIIAFIFLCSSCHNETANGNQTSADSSTAHSDSTGTKMNPISKDDSDFAVQADIGGMAEVAMGKLAQSNATDQRVKDFGSMVVRDHSKAGDKLKQIASQKNIYLPGTLDKTEERHLNELKKKNGSDFDKIYMKMMVDDHKDDIKEFQKAANNCKDGDLKNFAAATLPVLQKHLDSANAITKKD